MSDVLLKFLFENALVRGEVVRLHDSWRKTIEFHRYPPAVIHLLGEMTAAAALLSSTIKFSGSLILQIHGDGPVQLLVVECQPDLRLRATAKLRSDADAALLQGDADLQTLVNAHGRGRCVITLDPKDRLPGQQPYQGVVALEGNTIAQALESYMRQSEQLESRLWLAADNDNACGLLLQRLPGDGGKAPAAQDVDAWDRASALASTLSPQELLSQTPENLVHRLFWQERLQHSAPLMPRFECTCSRERIGRMLLSLGQQESDSIIEEQGRVEVTCDFCNARYEFDAIDVAQLFTTGSSAQASQTRPH